MATGRDIVIAGGGMVGVSLALQLDACLGPEISISLIESFPLPQPREGEPLEYHPSFDARSTAVSYSSRLIYESIGVWHELQRHVSPIDTVHVSSRGHFGSSLMRGSDYDWPSLGYVIENAWLGSALVAALHARPRVEICSPVRVLGAGTIADGVRLKLDGETSRDIDTRLLVIADGADSGLCRQLGVAAEEKPYEQSALVANIAFARGHQGCAYERFASTGPLALLPLQGISGAPHRCSLVWTLPEDRARDLQQCPEEEFRQALQRGFGYRLGRVLQVGERHCYPLSMVRAAEQVRPGVVVIGNAAHSLHPVAGQGFNLALRDVAALANELAAGTVAGASPGDLSLLGRYQKGRAADQELTIQFSDLMPGLFMHRDPLLGLARDLSLSGLDLLVPLKRQFVRHAAGMAALTGVHLDGN